MDPEAADTAASEGEAGGQPASAAASLGLPRNHTTPTPRDSRRADSSLPGSAHTCTPGGQGHCAPQSGTDRSFPCRPQTLPLPAPPTPARPALACFLLGFAPVPSTKLSLGTGATLCAVSKIHSGIPHTHTAEKKGPWPPFPEPGRTRRKPGALLCPGAGCAGHRLVPGEVQASTRQSAHRLS